MSDEDLIKQYLVYELGYAEMPAEVLYDKITKYDDIKAEFVRWLKERNYEAEEPVVVEGYNALAVADVFADLSGIGVYNVLVDLREHPKEMAAMIAERLDEE